MEALLRRLGQGALAGPFLQRTDLRDQRKEKRSQAREQQINLRMRRDPGKKLERESLHAIRFLAPLHLRHLFAKFDQQLRNFDLNRAHLGASAA